MSPVSEKVSNEEFGFAKVKGFSFWPAKKTGEIKNKLWVKFFGVNQMGCVSKNDKHWLALSDTSFNNFVNSKAMKKKNYLKAIKEMANVIKERSIL